MFTIAISSYGVGISCIACTFLTVSVSTVKGKQLKLSIIVSGDVVHRGRPSAYIAPDVKRSRLLSALPA